jgi:hypothetical protein
MPFPSTAARPAGAPCDSFAGADLYPIPDAPQAYPWGKPIGDLIVPLICTTTTGLWLIDGRFFVGVKGLGGVRLHAGLTRDGWICPNGARFQRAPALLVAAGGLVRTLLRDIAAPGSDAEELITAAILAADEAAAAIRGVPHA